MRPHTVSGHLLRRTARQRERKLQSLIDARDAGVAEASAMLARNGVPPGAQGVRVEATVRGPFGWRVVAT